MSRRCLVLPILLSGFVFADELKPLMAVPGKVVLQKNFDRPEKLAKTDWKPRQRTRWEVKDGVLLGIPSSAEEQAKRTHHRGLEPRGSAEVTPMNFVARLSIRYLGEESTPQTPFIEFGHHNCRVQFSKESGAFLLVESETKKVAQSENFSFESGKWYHILAEMVEDEFVFQIQSGPAFHTKNVSFPQAKEHAVGVAGFRGGSIEIDDFTIWQAAPGEYQKGWREKRASFPEFKPVLMEKRIAQLAKKKASEARH